MIKEETSITQKIHVHINHMLLKMEGKKWGGKEQLSQGSNKQLPFVS